MNFIDFQSAQQHQKKAKQTNKKQENSDTTAPGSGLTAMKYYIMCYKISIIQNGVLKKKGGEGSTAF